MHLQQTKRGSRDSGGPQYYFHDLTEAVKTYLRKKGAVQVALVTPYGATKSDYFAVSTEHKLDTRLRPIPGSVGHDRIQQGNAAESIGESIRSWYRLPDGDFEKIVVDIEIRDDVFYLTPLKYKYAGKPREKEIERIDKPLSITEAYTSPFWSRNLVNVENETPGIVGWSLAEIARIVRDHDKETRIDYIKEEDLLRASGPLKHLGVSLGPYVGKGYDCVSEFTFLDYPTYTIPVELKKFSHGFHYQQKKYGIEELSRAVVLCAFHDHKQIQPHIDVIELSALSKQLKQFPS